MTAARCSATGAGGSSIAGLAPSTVNLALAEATSLLDSRALPAPRVPRVELDPPATRALSPEQLRAVQRETDRLRSSRDRAIRELLLRTGLRIGELADLDAGDVRLTQRTGELVVRHGKGDRRRVVPLNRSARAALRAWLVDRERHPAAPARDRGPLWVSRTGQQLSVRSITKLVTKVMAAAGVEETAHGLRHTLATRLGPGPWPRSRAGRRRSRSRRRQDHPPLCPLRARGPPRRA